MGSFARKANNKILVYSEKLYSAERIEYNVSFLFCHGRCMTVTLPHLKLEFQRKLKGFTL